MRPPFCKMAAPREKTAGRTPGRRPQDLDKRQMALNYSEKFKISSREEANIVLNLTQHLSDQLEQYFLKYKGLKANEPSIKQEMAVLGPLPSASRTVTAGRKVKAEHSGCAFTFTLRPAVTECGNQIARDLTDTRIYPMFTLVTQGPRHRWSLESCLCDSSPATTLRFTYDHGQVISLVVIVATRFPRARQHFHEIHPSINSMKSAQTKMQWHTEDSSSPVSTYQFNMPKQAENAKGLKRKPEESEFSSYDFHAPRNINSPTGHSVSTKKISLKRKSKKKQTLHTYLPLSVPGAVLCTPPVLAVSVGQPESRAVTSQLCFPAAVLTASTGGVQRSRAPGTDSESPYRKKSKNMEHYELPTMHSSSSNINVMVSPQQSSSEVSAPHSSSNADTYRKSSVPNEKVSNTFGGEMQNSISQKRSYDNTSNIKPVQETKSLNDADRAKPFDLGAEENTAVPGPSCSTSNCSLEPSSETPSSSSSSKPQGKTSNTLSPDILQLLKGQDASTVTNILRTLSPFYPALQDKDYKNTVPKAQLCSTS
ncbi:unnamed protein product [Ranitomeya imitator]|uniref:Uncharacterized protein n=1 Tax=Ranitomeya imitator TaxID=111125 RepID=A0ABN9MHP0_9NEOB|nr:unnamed protein product [Ranitomeya imitator]